jgi:hypothetical protein
MDCFGRFAPRNDGQYELIRLAAFESDPMGAMR